MIARRGVLTSLAGGAVLALGACGKLWPARYRFRMTVEAETSEGIRSGSSVMEISAFERTPLTSEDKAGGGGLRGEAVVLDHPAGPIFVLTNFANGRGNLGTAVTSALLPTRQIGSINDYVAAVKRLGGDKLYRAALPREDWPIMVRFRDINDPKTVEQVDPESLGIKRVVVETTSDPVTTGIENRLPPWFLDLFRRKVRLNGESSSVVMSNALAGRLSPGAFSTEIGR